MDTINWLLQGDLTIQFLVKTHLLDQSLPQTNGGYIQNYLNLYDNETKTWGKGLYGPKWTSSTYTLLELIELEACPDDKMREAYMQIRQGIVRKYTLNPNDKQTLDLCIAGMLVRIGAYLRVDEILLQEPINYILSTVNEDGAWNCYFNYRPYKTSSLHTTLNVLEGLDEFVRNGYHFRLEEVLKNIKTAQEFILQKKLFRARRTNEIIHEQFITIHFPTRWCYDMFRAMEYFVNSDTRYDSRMEEALTIMKSMLLKGPVPKGKTYTGKVHFTYSLEDYKRMNTYRVLKIVKKYDFHFYQDILKKRCVLFKKY